MKRLNRFITIWICLLLVVGLITGCGNGKTESIGGGGDSEDTVKAYKIGVLAPITGTNAEFGKGFQVATQMAADEINAKGEMKIELNIKDSKGDPKESADLARMFADDDSIIAIVGDFTSSCSMASAPIIDEAGIVLLAPTASHPDYAGMSEYAFSIASPADGEAIFFSKQIFKNYANAKDIGVIWINNDWGKAAHDTFVKAAKADGLNVVADVNYIADEKDFSSAIANLRSAKPDHILILDQGAAPTIINQIAQANWTNVKIGLLGPGTSAQLLSLCGENAEGLLISTPFFLNPSIEGDKAWEEEFTKRAGFSPTAHPALAYDCAKLVANAIKNSGEDVTRDKIRENLSGLKDYVGLTGPINFKDDGSIRGKYLIVVVENGKFVQKSDYIYADQ